MSQTNWFSREKINVNKGNNFITCAKFDHIFGCYFRKLNAISGFFFFAFFMYFVLLHDCNWTISSLINETHGYFE